MRPCLVRIGENDSDTEIAQPMPNRYSNTYPIKQPPLSGESINMERIIINNDIAANNAKLPITNAVLFSTKSFLSKSQKRDMLNESFIFLSVFSELITNISLTEVICRQT